MSQTDRSNELYNYLFSRMLGGLALRTDEEGAGGYGAAVLLCDNLSTTNDPSGKAYADTRDQTFSTSAFSRHKISHKVMYIPSGIRLWLDCGAVSEVGDLCMDEHCPQTSELAALTKHLQDDANCLPYLQTM